MKDWAAAERIVEKMAGGKITPGSGNQRIKGDVRVGRHAIIEVKQTQSKKAVVQRAWLDKLVRESSGEQLVLALFFELRGYTWWLEPEHLMQEWEEPANYWATTTVTEDRLPDRLLTEDGWWHLKPLSSLRELKQ